MRVGFLARITLIPKDLQAENGDLRPKSVGHWWDSAFQSTLWPELMGPRLLQRTCVRHCFRLGLFRSLSGQQHPAGGTLAFHVVQRPTLGHGANVGVAR